MLPRLQADASLRAAQATVLPHLERDDRRRVVEAWERAADAGPAGRAVTRPSTEQLAAAGIAVVPAPPGSGGHGA